MRCSPTVICKHAYLLPPIASFGVSISGIVIALIYKNSYLTIPPGIGLSISVYFTKLSIDMKQLKTFAQNNDLLSKQINRMSKENLLLKKTGETLAGEVTKLQAHVVKVEEQLTEHKKNNAEHRALIEKQAEQLEEQRQLGQQQKERIASLVTLNEEQYARFQEIEACTKAQNQEMGAHCKTLGEVTERFSGELDHLETWRVEVKQEQTEILDKFRKDEFMQKRAEELQKMEGQVEQLKITIIRNEATSVVLGEHVDRLRKEQERLGHENDRLHGIGDGFAKILEEANSRERPKVQHETTNTTALPLAL